MLGHDGITLPREQGGGGGTLSRGLTKSPTTTSTEPAKPFTGLDDGRKNVCPFLQKQNGDCCDI